MGILATVTGAGQHEIVPLVKYSATAGRLYQVERIQTDAGWSNTEHEVPLPARFVVDFPNMQVGPMAFINKTPDFHLIRMADLEAGKCTMPAQPTAEHKNGFVLRLYSKSMGLRVWSGMSKCVCGVMDQVYDAYKAAPESGEGKLPVLELSGITKVRYEGKFARTDMVPIIKIVQWIARPEGLPVPPASDAAPISNNVTPLRPAMASGRPAHVPPPPPTPQQVRGATALVSSGDDDPEIF